MRGWLSAVALVLIGTYCSADDAPGSWTIDGLVMDDESRPVADALVGVWESWLDDYQPFSRTTRTGPAGYFSIAVQRPGSVHLQVGLRGYSPSPITSVAIQQAHGLTLTLSRAGEIRGSVVDHLGQATPGARVTMAEFTAIQRLTNASLGAGVAVADANGKFVLSGIEVGQRVVVVDDPRLPFTPLPVTVSARATEMSIVLPAPGTIEGTVTGSSPTGILAMPLNHGHATLDGARGSLIDERGSFLIKGLRSGVYILVYDGWGVTRTGAQPVLRYPRRVVMDPALIRKTVRVVEGSRTTVAMD